MYAAAVAKCYVRADCAPGRVADSESFGEEDTSRKPGVRAFTERSCEPGRSAARVLVDVCALFLECARSLCFVATGG